MRELTTMPSIRVRYTQDFDKRAGGEKEKLNGSETFADGERGENDQGDDQDLL